MAIRDDVMNELVGRQAQLLTFSLAQIFLLFADRERASDERE
jgi:hypothetical protein